MENYAGMMGAVSHAVRALLEKAAYRISAPAFLIAPEKCAGIMDVEKHAALVRLELTAMH
jgi:hypothetical protein